MGQPRAMNAYCGTCRNKYGLPRTMDLPMFRGCDWCDGEAVYVKVLPMKKVAEIEARVNGAEQEEG